MSEVEARNIASSAGIPWIARGKGMWNDWADGLEARGLSPEGNKTGFAKYLQENKSSMGKQKSELTSTIDKGTRDVDGLLSEESLSGEEYDDAGEEYEEDDDLEDYDTEEDDISLEEEIRESLARESGGRSATVDSGLISLAKALSGTEELEEQERKPSTKGKERADPRIVSDKKSPYSPALVDEDAGKEESSDLITVISKSQQLSSEAQRVAVEEDDLYEDEYSDDDSEEDFGQFDAAHKTTSVLTSVAMQAVQSNSQHPAKMLQFLSTRKGQDTVLDTLESCCMGTIHADHTRCTKGYMDFDCDMAQGCKHFAGIGSEEDFSGLSELHSQLKHASSDDAVSSVISQCAEEAFDEVAEVATNAYKRNQSEKTDDEKESDADGTSFFPVSDRVHEEEDIGALEDTDLDAITRNYKMVRAVAFATLATSALQKSQSETKSVAELLVLKIITWFKSPEGKRLEGEINLGFQCTVAILISIIKNAPRGYFDEEERKRAYEFSHLMLNLIDSSSLTKEFDPEFLEYDVPGKARVRRGRRGRFKKFARRLFRKVAKITTPNEFKLLKDVVKGCENNYAIRLSQYASDNPTQQRTSVDTKNQIAREMMNEYLEARGKREADKMFRAIRGLTLGSGNFATFQMTLRIMAMTAALLLTHSPRPYTETNSRLVQKNLTDRDGFLPDAIAAVNVKIREYSLKKLRKKGKGAWKGGKQAWKGGKGAWKGGKRAWKEEAARRKSGEHDEGEQETVFESAVPHPVLSGEDKKLQPYERDFMKRAVSDALDYADVILLKEHASGKAGAGKAHPKSSVPKQFHFVIIIPDGRNFRNQSARKITTGGSFRWVMQTPSEHWMDRSPAFNKEVSTHRKPAWHKIWKSLPPFEDAKSAEESQDRFQFRFYPKTGRLERIATEAPPKHSSYQDESGEIVRLKTKRDKKHVYLSDPFTPSDGISKTFLARAALHTPSSVHISYRRSFG